MEALKQTLFGVNDTQAIKDEIDQAYNTLEEIRRYLGNAPVPLSIQRVEHAIKAHLEAAEKLIS